MTSWNKVFRVLMLALLLAACESPAPAPAPAAGSTSGDPASGEPIPGDAIPGDAIPGDPSAAGTNNGPPTGGAPTSPGTGTAAQVPTPPPSGEGATAGAIVRPAPKTPLSKELLPEDAELIGAWQDTHSYASGVPVVIYGRANRFYFGMQLPDGSAMRIPLDKRDETHYVRANERDLGEQFVIVDGDLQMLDADGLIGTSKPLP